MNDDASYAYELLKNYANNIKIGVAANTMKFNNASYNEALKAFNYMDAENGCKLASIQPRKGVYNFNDCDDHYNRAKQLGMVFRGHCLIWYSDQPDWFKFQILLILPRKVSPSTKLFYNDYNTKGIWAKSKAVYNFVADLKKRNILIGGVGLQYHVSVKNQPAFGKINNLIDRYCKLGIEVHITELDVSCEGACGASNEQQQQATIFTNALKLVLTILVFKIYK
ncbi:glycoside hydrolase [Neocallimastix lanati (nom. inval.)]|nr:glycoside hydrolase [Neocallimastix sp. JGI-2020a]